jgi:hypothetical protein
MDWTGKWVQGQKMAMYQMVVVDLRLLPHHCDSMKTCMSMSMAYLSSCAIATLYQTLSHFAQR